MLTQSHYSSSSMLSTILILTLFIIISLFFIAPHIIIFHPPPTPSPSIPPSDEADDVTLFNHALSNSNKLSHLSSNNHNLKLAFLFLTNSNLHFTPLWELFFHNHPPSLFNIYIHSDPFLNLSLPSSPLFRNRLIPSKRTFRASPTLISATRRLLAHSLLDDPSNAYFLVLSQYCIPLHSFRFVYNSLFLSNSFDLSHRQSQPDPLRLTYRSFVEILSDAPRLWKRYVARGRYAMMPEVPFHKFRVGSQFFTLTRKHALLVIKDTTLWKKFKIPCYREDECYPEEHYFPTLLSMADPDGCTNYTLTNVNWTGTVNGHPYTYRPNEVSPELITRLRHSNYSESYLFARKFTPDCLEPLMQIAKSIIFRDSN
ncbi:unnamed protein product [Lupinus luteus]|uniref:Uncharacterized protein n=1 Tax=Lupinus luteus TaxID=3873 RepID=A0AAV1XJQ9_LUPLU